MLGSPCRKRLPTETRCFDWSNYRPPIDEDEPSEPVRRAASRASKVRGHIGDTIRCFLLFLERHPVRSRSCSLLELRLAIPAFTAVTRVQIPSVTPTKPKQLAGTLFFRWNTAGTDNFIPCVRLSLIPATSPQLFLVLSLRWSHCLRINVHGDLCGAVTQQRLHDPFTSSPRRKVVRGAELYQPIRLVMASFFAMARDEHSVKFESLVVSVIAIPSMH
jgi:hypothetical protein